EDKLVLATDLVDVSDVRPIVRRATGDHLLARSAFAAVVRRAVDVDQELGAVIGLPGHRARRIPAVFADRHADPDARQLEYWRPVAGREIALLVEDPVVRQEDLVVHGLDLAVVHE